MENNLFDNEIRNLIQDMEVPFMDNHWTDMQNRLKEISEPNTTDDLTQFDTTISDKISNLEQPFVESHWLDIQKRLVLNNYLQKWILHTKIMETILVVLISITFLNTYVSPSKTTTQPILGPIALVPAPANKDIHSPQPNTFTGQITEMTSTRKNNRNLTSVIPFLEQNTTASYPTVLAATDVNRPTNIPSSITSQTSLNYLSQIPLTEITNPTLNIAVNLPRITITQKHPTMSLSLYAITNADQVITGTDPVHQINTNDLWSPGYGGGIAFTRHMGARAFSTGIEYQKTKYFPQPIVTVLQGDIDLGYGGKGTSTVELDRINIPLAIEQTLVNRKKHKFSVGAGLVASIGHESFKQSTYLFNSPTENQNQLRNKTNLAPQQPSAYTARQKTSNTSKVDTNKFYAYSRANLSYEYKVTKHHVLFAKATYQHQISNKGIGLPNDMVHSFGFQFGSKVYL